MMARPLFKMTPENMPSEFPPDAINIIRRIATNAEVIGMMYFHNKNVAFCIVPENMHSALTTRLPQFSVNVHQAVTEIDIQNELISYKIECNSCEIIVVGGKNLGACVVQKKTRRQRNTKK